MTKSLRYSSLLLIAAVSLAPALSLAQAGGGARPDFYVRSTLTANGPVVASFQDAALQDPTALAFNPAGLAWVVNRVFGIATFYDGNGRPDGFVISIPAINGSAASRPTSIVFNESGNFVVRAGNRSGAAKVLFGTQEGTIAGWSPSVSTTTAVIAIDNSAAGARYFGVALGSNGRTRLLFATDFFNGRIDIFDADLRPISMPGAFTSSTRPRSFAPLGIAVLDGDVYVTFNPALSGSPAQCPPVPSPGAGACPGPVTSTGFVEVFDPAGRFIRRITHTAFSFPFQVVRAPLSYGRFGGLLLVANAGNGEIHAFRPDNGQFVGALNDENGSALRVPALAGLAFGNGINDQATNTLFYTAGVTSRQRGQFGSLRAQRP